MRKQTSAYFFAVATVPKEIPSSVAERILPRGCDYWRFESDDRVYLTCRVLGRDNDQEFIGSDGDLIVRLQFFETRADADEFIKTDARGRGLLVMSGGRSC